MDLSVVGLNHRETPLGVREKVAFRRPDLAEGLLRLVSEFDLREALILSTCNRVEVYAAGLKEGHEPSVVARFLSSFHGIPEEGFAGGLYARRRRDAVVHLFRVASGLDSMILGEHQIQGQVKEAYEAACASSCAGPLLHAVFQRALFVARRVRTETEVGRGEASVAGAVVSLARRIFDAFSDTTFLLIGAGEIGTVALRRMAQEGVGRVLVCNRTPEKSEDLAAAFGGRAVPFEGLGAALAEADIVVGATEAKGCLVTPEAVRAALKIRRGRPMLLVDLAVPRDIHPDVNRIDRAFLYDLDDLQAIVQDGLKERGEAARVADPIVEEEASRLLREARGRRVGEVIERLRERVRAAAMEELRGGSAPLDGGGENGKIPADRVVERVVNRILHRPILALKEAAASGDGEEAARAVEKMFGLLEEK